LAKSTYRPSFYFTINSLFILLIVGVGLVLSWYNYRSTREIVLSAAHKAYDQIVREVSLDFSHTYSPVFETVRLLSMTPVMDAATPEARLESLGMLTTSLQNQQELAGIQVGYANGDYFIVRPLATDKGRSLFEAPDKAVYVVDHITADPAGKQRQLLRLYFDKELQEISRREPEVTEYDPRNRPWYKQAVSTHLVTAVEPYLFYFMQEIGTTVGYRPADADAVIAADVTMGQLSSSLNKHQLTPRSQLALIDADGRVLAFTRPENIIVSDAGGRITMARIDELKSGVMEYISMKGLLAPGPLEFIHDREEWLGEIRTFNVSGIKGRDLTLVMVSPARELLADAIAMVRRSLVITGAIILLLIPVVSLVAAFISRAMRRLAMEAELIGRFDFAKPVSVRSRIREIDELARSMLLMKATISRFLSLIKSLAGEQNFDAMLEQITAETLNVSGADGVLTWLVDDRTGTLNPGALFGRDLGRLGLEGLPVFAPDSDNVLIQALHGTGATQVRLAREKDDGLGILLDKLETAALDVTAIPLRNRQNEDIGLLCLLKKTDGAIRQEVTGNGRMDFVRTFSGFAAVSLESRQLLEMQKRLMDSFMHLLAGAIDAKSAYTGGHCQRVPVITKMLARAASEDQKAFKAYQLDDEGWEALHLAGWLHDCGKVTTPEYVVDKATKLETIYDRIHEIRTRFEVLKRDAEVRYWEQVAAGADKEELRRLLEQEWREIDADFAFVAECNLGGELMAPEKIERLEKIAQRTWTRTLDDRLGISWEEEQRKARAPESGLPVVEQVLADRQDHLIERNENERMPEDNPWGFRLDVPEYRYNLGELYNLKIERGTLTAEERYKINDHIVQTIIMLEKLPYPKHLRNVPELAGGHHETMDGKGYPKRLTAAQMSLTARMMAIADIFEALTASDRPYKKAKKLSETVRIMNFMKKDRHIDPDLFELFLRSGVYRQYAEEYLEPSQIDEVDIEQYLSPSGG